MDRLLTVLGIDHLNYRLIHALIEFDQNEQKTWLCASHDFRTPGESKLPLDDYYDLKKVRDESPMDFCKRMGWESYIYEMLVVDYLILNRDRHGANIEVLYHPEGGSVRLAPLFDHGLSLLCTCLSEEALERFDVMKDLPVQSFVGSHSSLDNLSLIPKKKRPKLRELQKRDKAILFKDLEDALSKEHLEKIWDMIWKRWNTYASL